MVASKSRRGRETCPFVRRSYKELVLYCSLMSAPFTVACIQNCADDNLERNIAETMELVRQAHAGGAELICLPEYFPCIEPDDRALFANARSEDDHPALPAYRSLAAELKCWVLLGSIAVKLDNGKVNNRSYLLNGIGEIVATYNKVHLFDVELKAGEHYRESATVEPGTAAVVADTPWGGLGLTVCYDVRFSYLYRELAQAGADFLTVPAAFTHTTGKAHWHILLRARAIETGCFVFAPGQSGVRPWGRATYGHSLIVDPWGKVLADGGEEPGFVLAQIDPARVVEARGMIPSLDHDRKVKKAVRRNAPPRSVSS